MTREEAITYLKVIWNRYKAEYEIERETLDAYHMAIEALQAEEMMVIQTGQTHGKSAYIKELAEVVRCKDCRQYIPYDLTEAYGWCFEFKTPIEEDDFCSHGERKK